MRPVAFVALALLIACGADAMTSHVLMDAGELARDAAQLLDAAADAMGDAGRHVGDAAAQAGADTHDVACSAEYMRTTTSGASTTETWQYFAELELDTGAITGIDARLCGRSLFGRDPFTTACEAPACTGQDRPAYAPCAVGQGVELEPQRARVYCGQRQRVTTGASVTESGYRFATAKLTVRR
jgi:hypothetical protein